MGARLMAPYRSAPEAVEQPRIVDLGDGLAGAAFALMKLLPARQIIERAQGSGEIGPGTRVIETSSGTFGLGLAMVCRLRGIPLTIVGDPIIDRHLRRRLEALGAEVEIVSGKALERGVQQARLDRVAALQARHRDHFVPRQYDNPQNPDAYASVAEVILESVGPIDCLVATVGSGGSGCGTASYLRSVCPDMTLVGVDTPGSVLFGTPDRPRLLRGLGSGVYPRNVDHHAFDEVHWIGPATAFLMARLLFRDHCMFMGPTSGAAYLVARDWGARHPDARVVALMPDEGHRYEATVYDERWLKRNDVLLDQPPQHPVRVGHPLEVAGEWSVMDWGRRSLDEVLRPEAA